MENQKLNAAASPPELVLASLSLASVYSLEVQDSRTNRPPAPNQAEAPSLSPCLPHTSSTLAPIARADLGWVVIGAREPSRRRTLAQDHVAPDLSKSLGPPSPNTHTHTYTFFWIIQNVLVNLKFTYY